MRPEPRTALDLAPGEAMSKHWPAMRWTSGHLDATARHPLMDLERLDLGTIRRLPGCGLNRAL